MASRLNLPRTCSTTTAPTVAMGRPKARTRGAFDPSVQCLLPHSHAGSVGRRSAPGVDLVSGRHDLAAPGQRLRVAELRRRVPEDPGRDPGGARLLASFRLVRADAME